MEYNWLAYSKCWSNIVRCKLCVSPLFSLLFKKNGKNRMLWFYDDGWHRVEEPPMLWYQMLGTRPSVRKSKQHSVWWRACVWDNEIDTQREREREREIGTKKQYIPIGNSYKWQPALTKGYKVTLYSAYLRATALYVIYINGPNLGCPKGQCEYGHYILVFDKNGMT